MFNESAMFTSDVSTSATNQISEHINVQVEHEGDVDDHAPPSPEPAENSSSSPIVESVPQSLAQGRTRRQIVRPQRLIEECNVAFALAVAEEVDNAQEPLNYSEAILSADSEKWMGAMHEEMESLDKNGT